MHASLLRTGALARGAGPLLRQHEPSGPASLSCPAASPARQQQGGESVSGRGAPVNCGSSARRVRRGPAPCRITNTAKEIYQAIGKLEDDGMVESHDQPLPGGGVGVLEAVVKRTYLDAMADDEVDLLESDFWFNPSGEEWEAPPPGEPLESVEANFPQPFHNPSDGLVVEEDGQEVMYPRIPLDTLKTEFSGRVITGFITDMWLYHGLQVDIGAEFDGLVPITEMEWEDVNAEFEPGQEVQVEVHTIMRPGLYRWPLLLRLADKQLAARITDPDDYHHPINHGWAYAQGWNLQQLLHVTGRTYTPAKVYMRRDDADEARDIMDMYGAGNPEYVDGSRPPPGQAEFNGLRLPQVEDMAGAVLAKTLEEAEVSRAVREAP